MSDRVRFYLEGSVKEIQDLKKRGIFEQDELAKIMKRRTDYEHRLLSRTVKPEDFLSYVKYEGQVDRLRQLRIKRLKLSGKKSVSDWAGPRRINFTLERGTKRFPANLKLWMALVDYAHKNHSVNIVNRALASMLRLHPTNPDVWVYVAKFHVEQNANVPEARAVLQRGLRFNPDSQFLWLEYMRLELIYVAKILARRKILGIDHARKEEIAENEPVKQTEANTEEELTSDDLARANQDTLRDLPDVNVDILGDPETNPALRGDVALVIYDAAAARFNKSPQSELEFGLKVLSLFDEFKSLNQMHLCSHVIDSLAERVQENSETFETVEFLRVSLPLRNVEVDSPDFPDQLGLLFKVYGSSSKSVALKDSLRTLLAQKVLESDSADENLKKAVRVFESKM